MGVLGCLSPWEGSDKSRMVQQERKYYGEVEESEWMLHGQHPQASMVALTEILFGGVND